MNGIEKYFYLCIFLITLLLSCRKEKDKQPPLITILSPSENQPFQVYGNIPVKGTISDESILSKATVNLLNEEGVPVYKTVPVPVNTSTATIDIQYALNNIHLESGRYQICVFASDGKNDAYAYQHVYIEGVPRVVSEILVTTTTDTSETKISIVDSSGILTPYTVFSHDHLGTFVNSYFQTFFHCGNYNGHFSGFDLNNHSLLFDIPPVYTSATPYFTGFFAKDNTCYLSLYDEQIRGYDPQGAAIYHAKQIKGYFSRHMCLNGGQLITEEINKIKKDRKLVCYYATGVAKQSVALMQDVVSYCELDDTHVFVFGNTSGQATLQLYDRIANNLWNPYPYALASGSLLSALKLDADTYLIAHSNGTIYKYVYSLSSITPYLTGYVAIQLLNDNVSNTLYVIEKNKISTFDLFNLQPLRTIHSAENIREVNLVYNR